MSPALAAGDRQLSVSNRLQFGAFPRLPNTLSSGSALRAGREDLVVRARAH